MDGLNRITTADSFGKNMFNQIMDAIESASQKAIGRGVLAGLDLSDDGGLTLGIAAGVAHARCANTYEATTFTVTNNATNYIWLDEDGTITESASSADPGGYVVCLGRVTASGGNITTVETTGRMSLWRQTSIRNFELGDSLMVVDMLNGRIGVGTTPTTEFDVAGQTTLEDVDVTADAVVAGKVKTSTRLEIVEVGADPDAPVSAINIYVKDSSGKPELFLNDEDDHVMQLTKGGVIQSTARTVNVETISATKQLTLQDACVQALTASGGNRDVELPATLTFGHWFRIMNVGSSNNIVVKDSTGTTTVVTLTPGQYAVIEPVHSSGSPAWPATATATGMGSPL